MGINKHDDGIETIGEDDDFGYFNVQPEAMRDLELIETCFKSGKGDGQPVSLPLA